jgi:acyl-CoA thioesterase FadM
MARVKLVFPETVHFNTQYTVHVGDLNYGNHLGNDKILTIVHQARLEMLKHFDCSELDLFGVSLIQGDAAIVYQSEGFLHDTILIEMNVGGFTSSGFELWYRLFNKTTSKPLALVKTGMVCFDYDARKVVRCPEKWSSKFI